MSRLIDADTLPRHGDRGGLVHWKDIENAPTIEPPSWIPVSERMPDEFGEYLVTKKAIGWNCKEYNSNDIAYFDNEGFHKADKVLAWMPLPEPYSEEDT